MYHKEDQYQLISDNTILLDYKHQFIGSLQAVDSRSQTQVLSHCYLHRVLEWY